MRKQQLYTLTHQDYRFPIAVTTHNQAITVSAERIPMLFWPDGRWCFEANLYMLELFERGLSRKENGGTLAIYAANISHLIRYCFQHYIDFLHLTDNQFTLFIYALQKEQKRNQINHRKRNANTVINIGRNCLDFLFFLGRFHHQGDFIGKNGHIRAEKKEMCIKIQGTSKIIHRSFWHHHAFPQPDCKAKVLPINQNTIIKLREAITQLSTSLFLRRRRQLMLMMLEVTGGRRGEIARLTVESVRKAQAMKTPMLELITLKRKSSPLRQIPISRPDLDLLISFIEKQRQPLIKKLKLQKDHGYVFVSETSGQPLNTQTISQEIYALAKAISIEGKAHAHMFRHRFITKLFVNLIEQHAFENTDDFRRALLDTETLKQKVQQWTGHTRLSSLDTYIHLAFEEVVNFKKAYDVVSLANLVESVQIQTGHLDKELGEGKALIDAVQNFKQLLNNFSQELKTHYRIV